MIRLSVIIRGAPPTTRFIRDGTRLTVETYGRATSRRAIMRLDLRPRDTVA